MDQKLPKNLDFAQLKPVGYPAMIKPTKFTPQTITSLSTADIIRFNINSDGFWDPYSAYIEMEVDTTDMDYGTLQIDNSAASFISSFIATKSGVEIERIDEYDGLAAILNDMNLSIEQRIQNKYQGLGGYHSSSTFAQQELKQLGFQTRGASPYPTSQIGLVPFVQYKGYQPWWQDNSLFGIYEDNGVYKGQQSGQNLDGTANGFPQNFPDAMTNNIVRYDSNHNNLCQSEYIEKADYCYKNINQKVNAGNVSISSQYDFQRALGFRDPFKEAFCGTSFEPTFSNSFNQPVILSGKGGQISKITKARFQIPLLSGLLGALMPRESYKYIPMTVLKELMLEFRLSPYAMFTSGYTDIQGVRGWDNINLLLGDYIDSNAYTLNGNFLMQKRKWKIVKFDINVEIHYFEPQIENIILGQLDSENGIILHTNSWQLGPLYQFNPNTGPNGSYQVNLGFESLKNLLFYFTPNDYQSYTFCRKQYRISHNITELQIKIGNDYYPPEKLTGHGGTPKGLNSNSQNNGNNSSFIIELQKTFGKFNNIAEDCFITGSNFAINERPYDITRNDMFFTLTNGTANQTAQYQINNIHTAYGCSLFHENRCVGKAIYALNLETLNTDNSVISGINTVSSRPFEIMLKSDTLQFTDIQGNPKSAAFERASTMYVFCHYDMLIQLKRSGIRIMGRG